MYVINKESALTFIHLKMGGVEMALCISKSWQGTPGLAPPVRVCTGRQSSGRQRGHGQLVDNAWLASDLRVTLLSGLLGLEAEFQGGREASYLSAC